MSRSRTKVQVISAIPSEAYTVISSIPLTDEIASSSGKTTPVIISSGVAPGKFNLTSTVAGAGFWEEINDETPQKKKTTGPHKTNTDKGDNGGPAQRFVESTAAPGCFS